MIKKLLMFFMLLTAISYSQIVDSTNPSGWQKIQGAIMRLQLNPSGGITTRHQWDSLFIGDHELATDFVTEEGGNDVTINADTLSQFIFNLGYLTLGITHNFGLNIGSNYSLNAGNNKTEIIGGDTSIKANVNGYRFYKRPYEWNGSKWIPLDSLGSTSDTLIYGKMTRLQFDSLFSGNHPIATELPDSSAEFVIGNKMSFDVTDGTVAPLSPDVGITADLLLTSRGNIAGTSINVKGDANAMFSNDMSANGDVLWGSTLQSTGGQVIWGETITGTTVNYGQSISSTTGSGGVVYGQSIIGDSGTTFARTIGDKNTTYSETIGGDNTNYSLTIGTPIGFSYNVTLGGVSQSVNNTVQSQSSDRAILTGTTYDMGTGSYPDTVYNIDTNIVKFYKPVTVWNGAKWDSLGNKVDFADTVTKVVTPTSMVYYLHNSYGIAQIPGINITTPITDQVLKYNGSQWVNATSGSGGTGSNNPDSLGGKSSYDYLLRADSLTKYYTKFDVDTAKANIRTTIGSLSSTLSGGITDSITAHRTAINKNIDSVTSHNNRLNVIRDSITSHNNRINVLKDTTNSHNTRINASIQLTKDSISVHRTFINTLKDTATSHNTRINASIQLTKDSIAVMRVAVNAGKDSITSHNNRINTNRQIWVDSLAGDNTRLNAVNQRLNDSLAVHRTALNKAVDSIAVLRAAIQSHTTLFTHVTITNDTVITVTHGYTVNGSNAIPDLGQINLTMGFNTTGISYYVDARGTTTFRIHFCIPVTGDIGWNIVR